MSKKINLNFAQNDLNNLILEKKLKSTMFTELILK